MSEQQYTVTFPKDQFNTLANLLQLMVVAGVRLHATGNALPTDEELAAVWKTIITATLSEAQDQDRATEVEYLRYFADKVYPCLGPADSEIVDSIKKQFVKKTGKKLPKGYEGEE